VSCVSVVDLYSSCVALSDASASSLAWLISLNCCIWLRAEARSTSATLSEALEISVSTLHKARQHGRYTEGPPPQPPVAVLEIRLLHGYEWHRLLLEISARIPPASLCHLAVCGRVPPHVARDAFCSSLLWRATCALPVDHVSFGGFVSGSDKSKSWSKHYLVIYRVTQFLGFNLPLQSNASDVLPLLIKLLTQILAGRMSALQPDNWNNTRSVSR
jgi:hypothetical protein